MLSFMVLNGQLNIRFLRKTVTFHVEAITIGLLAPLSMVKLQ